MRAQGDRQTVIALGQALEQRQRAVGRTRPVGRAPVGECSEHGAYRAVREPGDEGSDVRVLGIDEAFLGRDHAARQRGRDGVNVL